MVLGNPVAPPSRRKPRHRLQLALGRLLVVLAIPLSLRYFYWRATATMNPVAKWFFYLFLAAEGLNFFEALLFYFTTWKPTHHAQPDPLPRRSVDVLITTYDEPAELLRETLVCAVSMRYPHRTFVLDDGNRAEVRTLAEELGCGYLARTERTNAKAGNLNSGLVQTSGEFIVTLDADHIPMPDLIDRLIGFFADGKTAAVQASQDFYNLDSFQHLNYWEQHQMWQQQELFFSIIQPGKDGYNAAFYCGSPAMLRRAALEEIGGFAAESITEDMHTGLRLQKKGWRVVYYNRTVARGLAPQTFAGFSTQWQRWGQGAMQVLRQENVLFGKGLSFAQRVCYFSSFYYFWMSYQKLLNLLTPIFCLLTGIFPLVADPAEFATYFLPYFMLNVLASSVLEGGVVGFALSEQYNMIKIPLLMKSLSGLFEREKKFAVTPKSKSDAARWSDVGLQLFILAGLAVSLAAGSWRLANAAPGFPFWATTVNLMWAFFYVLLFTPVVIRAMTHRELRASYRFPNRLDVPTAYSIPGENGTRGQMRGFARNLNRQGFSVTQGSAIPQGTLLDVELSLPWRTIRARGRVIRNQRYLRGKNGCVANGVRFEQIDPADQDEISKYLFWEIAPRHGQSLRLTRTTQSSESETGGATPVKVPAYLPLLLAALLGAAVSVHAQAQLSPGAASTGSRFAQSEQEYRRVLQSDPNNADALGGLADALEAEGHWREAVPFLSRLIELQPNNSARVFQLAKMKSWREESRPEAMQLFARALHLDPENDEILVSYAEVLSWSRGTRPQAKIYYERALEKNPRNLRALGGKAQLLAWNGESDRAVSLYDQVLAADPSNVAALRGKAEILNWKRRHQEARDLLQRAQRAAPQDEGTIVELARADYGLHRYEEARREFLQIGAPGPETQDLQRGISQALGTFTEIGYGLRRNRRHLDYDQLEALVSTRVGASNRLGILYEPTLFRSQQPDFNSNYYGIMLDSQPSEKVTTHAEFDGEQYFGAPAQADGTFDLRYRVRPSFQLEAQFQRQIVDDSSLSLRGQQTGGIFLGQVRSNLGMVSGSYSNRKHNYDFSAAYSDGVYTGNNLDSNRRWSVEASLGKSVHSYHPYMRMAYNLTYLSFDHDADFQPGTAPASITGGYFSPTRYLLNSGQISVSHDFGKHIKWDGAATLGVQNAQTTFSQFSAAQFASTYSTHLVWTVNAKNEFRAGYDFLDVFNAFRRHLVRVSWRYYL
jgi:cellulose synthase (UDP-forming)